MSQLIHPLAAITTTLTGARRLLPLCAGGVTLWVPEAIAASLNFPAPVQVYHGSLREQVAALWESQQGMIFYLATGAVVRLIAPLLHDKATDPAIVVVSDQCVISLCGGHQAGADALARTVALQLGATAILTGSANQQGLPGVDLLGVPFGWQRGTGNWTGVSAAIAHASAQQPVQVIQDAGSPLWQAHLPSGHPFQFVAAPESAPDLIQESVPPAARVWISARQRQEAAIPAVQWHPRVLWVGVGCERGTPESVIAAAIQQVCQAFHLAEAAIAGVATIDLKADEVGIVELCRDRNWSLQLFSAAALRTVTVPTPSAVVAVEVGTPSVAEAAAILASQQMGGTVAAWESADQQETAPLLVAKQIIHHPSGAVTVAIAQAAREDTGRSGALWLIGTGPGALTQMTPAAQAALAQADVVIGYGLYIDLIAPLLRPGQIVEALPITQERQRALRAIELAQWGLTVAVVSSGDCGIYGMAGLVLEQLQTQGWDGKTPDVQVFPGITALQAAASRVGAPLMHDFCAISLSDLLTPWPVIEQRLTAAAQADFVTALYNPQSQTRRQQIAIAQQIFLNARDPDTPVAIVRAAYRPDEQIIRTTLSHFLQHPIDMLTIVLIGNRSTRSYAEWIITPRGYLGQQ